MGEEPEWVAENRALKRRFDLPEYEPPRFEDGVYTHEVIRDVEREYDCTITFAGKNTEYLDDWQVLADGTPVLTVGRHRDGNGNTVYEITSETLERQLHDALPIEDA